MAPATFEMINVGVASLRNERRVDALSDPAARTLELTPERRTKALKALERFVRSYKRRLYLHRFQLQSLLLFLKFKALSLKAIGYFYGRLR